MSIIKDKKCIIAEFKAFFIIICNWLDTANIGRGSSIRNDSDSLIIIKKKLWIFGNVFCKTITSLCFYCWYGTLSTQKNGLTKSPQNRPSSFWHFEEVFNRDLLRFHEWFFAGKFVLSSMLCHQSAVFLNVIEKKL